jgi:hypothetical protein
VAAADKPSASAAAPAAAAANQNASTAAVPEYFITVGPDGNFRNGCQTFFPAGWNQCVRFCRHYLDIVQIMSWGRGLMSCAG